jgi:hypothetical protein
VEGIRFKIAPNRRGATVELESVSAESELAHGSKSVNLFSWIEATGLAEWIRVSALGYPMMITLHSLGLAIMVGLSVVLALRVLGWFGTIPYAALHGLLKVAWVGFIVNTISGTALFAAQATTYVTDVTFLLKISLVFLGAIAVAWLQGIVKSSAVNWDGAGGAPALARGVAIFSIIAWAGATVTGRLIAYL